MKITYDHNYGADADGNRGITIIDEVILDDDDYQAVRDEIFEMYCGEEYNDYMTIYLHVENGDKTDFEVQISEYFDEGEFLLMKEELND